MITHKWLGATVHYGEPLEIAVFINCPDPQNGWFSTLDIFTLNWDKNLNFFCGLRFIFSYSSNKFCQHTNRRIFEKVI